MFARRSDLPLERDALGGFLPWLIAFMVYLAIIALAGVLVLETMAWRWDKGMSGTLTVQIPATGKDDARRLEAVMGVIRTSPGVFHAEALGTGRLMALLEPWLGDTAGIEDFPLPRLIDVEVAPSARVDVAALSRRLAAVAPGATVDDHGVWLNRLIRLIRTAEVLAAVVMALIGLACVGTVIFTTRTGLAIHHDAIEVLHLIGAQDKYVARQFAGRALSLGLRGGVAGMALAVPSLLGLGALARSMEVLPDFTLGPGHWVILAVPPLIAALIAMVTARVTVSRTLARMP